VQERADHISEWVRLTNGRQVGQIVQPVLADGRKAGPQHQKHGITQAARELPISGDTDEAKRKNVERAIKIAGLAPEAKEAAREHKLDDGG
jgi:hypothetical protein